MQTRKTAELATRLIAMRSDALREVRTARNKLAAALTLGGVEYLDDSASTQLDATLLSIMDLGRPLVWIADAALLPAIDGRMMEFMHDHVDGAVFHGEGDHALAELLDAELGHVYLTDTLRTAVFTARELAAPGGRVLYSPGRAAVPGGPDQAARSDEFRKALKDL